MSKVCRLARFTCTALTFLLFTGAQAVDFRWSESSNRIYVEGGGVATLTDIRTALPKAPLVLVQGKLNIWLLRANLVVTDGSMLLLEGSQVGGDVDELRLLSNNIDAPDAVVSVEADWGTIRIHATRVTSWDEAVAGPDTEFEMFGRAFIRVRSSLASDGQSPLESRMDIVGSDIGHLGYYAAESYGLSWKVRGAHPDPNESIFDHVEVYGDILDSRIHHNYFGVYTYGHLAGHWADNEIDHNVGYGFDPHDDSDQLVIENNDVHHNGNHGIIASKRCDRLIIRGNRSYANAKHGIMLHRHCDDTVIEDNRAFLNGSSGIIIYDSDRVLVQGNLLLSNTAAGLRLSMGSADNRVEANEIGYSTGYGLHVYSGGDPPEPDPLDPTLTVRTRRNVVVNNLIYGCADEGIRMTDADDYLFFGNVLQSNKLSFSITTSTSAWFVSNSIPGDVFIKLSGSSEFPTSTEFMHQPIVHLELRDTHTSAMFTDPEGAVFDTGNAMLFTTVEGPDAEGSSSLELTPENAGSSLSVFTRNLFATSTTGEVRVNPQEWNLSGDQAKEWILQAASANEVVSFRVGGFTPNRSFNVFKNGQFLEALTSDTTGNLQFADNIESTDPISHTAVAAIWVQPAIDQQGNFTLQWTTHPAGDYQVHFSEDLRVWVELGTPISPEPSQLEWTEEGTLSARRRGFYRVQQFSSVTQPFAP